MIIELRKVIWEDSLTLLEWSNESTTRRNSINQELITDDEHKLYMTKIMNNDLIDQYILIMKEIKVGTIKCISIDQSKYELSYTIAPAWRGKGLSQILLRLFLFERKGNFICRIKKNNISSIKLVEGLGFKLQEEDQDINSYHKRL